MKLSELDIKEYFSTHDYKLGNEYQRNSRVHSLTIHKENGEEFVSCTVRGSHFYTVTMRFKEKDILASCTCPRFKDAGKCKHLAAAMLEYSRRPEAREPETSDSNAQNLLRTYLSLASRTDTAPAGTAVRLMPMLDFHYWEQRGYLIRYPSLTFKVGGNRLYVVKSVTSLLQSWQANHSVYYGKQLTLDPALVYFDDVSLRLMDILRGQFEEFKSLVSQPRDPWVQYAASSEENSVTLSGAAFDAFFDLYKETSVALTDGTSLQLADGDPRVVLTVTPQGTTVQLEWSLPDDDLLFGSNSRLYACNVAHLLRCSDGFCKNLLPLLSVKNTSMRIAARDMPTFCSCVLPAVANHVTLEDPQGCLSAYTPDECQPCYYFDLQSALGLVCDLVFRYGSKKVPSGTSPDQKLAIKRDLLAERNAVQALTRYLEPIANEKSFHLSDEDAIADFMSDGIDTLRTFGDVFVSEQLRNKRITPSKPTVGVSVSNGLLTLDIDTGEFPPEELEALYASLLRKKRYHRLRDGRYLALNDSPYEKVAEIAHMTQLSAKDLKSGHSTMPAYRALYLSETLADAAGVQITRDNNYRALIRQFKEVSDRDDPLPPGFDDILRPYQKTGFHWLKMLDENGFCGILADEMGLGKTIQVIAYLSTVTRAVTGLPSLIVCPASLVLNWAEECARFAPSLQVSVILGTVPERTALLANLGSTDVLVTSYDLLKRDTERYENLSFYCCVLDEAQNVKNQTTRASHSVKAIVCRHRFVLTGTPVENRLSELWNLFDFLMPGYLFTQKRFEDKIEKPIIQSDDPAARRQLLTLVHPFMLRRLKADVLKELPPKVEHLRKIALSTEERKTYLAAVEAAKQEMLASNAGKFQIFAVLTRLRQICCDPNLCYSNFEGPASKLDACLELCAGLVENGHQILLFSQFTSMLDILAGRLDDAGISHYTLEGSTEKTRRAQLVKEFNAGGASIFLISLKAGGTGLNLTAADVVIHYDPWWNMAAQNQATDRAHRIGQQAHVQVYKLIAKDTIEERILELQNKKQSLLDFVSENEDTDLLLLPKEDLLALLG